MNTFYILCLWRNPTQHVVVTFLVDRLATYVIDDVSLSEDGVKTWCQLCERCHQSIYWFILTHVPYFWVEVQRQPSFWSPSRLSQFSSRFSQLYIRATRFPLTLYPSKMHPTSSTSHVIHFFMPQAVLLPYITALKAESSKSSSDLHPLHHCPWSRSSKSNSDLRALHIFIEEDHLYPTFRYARMHTYVFWEQEKQTCQNHSLIVWSGS